MKSFFTTEQMQIAINVLVFIALEVVLYFVYRFIMNYLEKRAAKTATLFDDFFIRVMRVPLLCIMTWVMFWVFSSFSFLSDMSFYGTIQDINNVLLIVSVGWILTRIVKIIFFQVSTRSQDALNENFELKEQVTRLNLIMAIVNTLIWAITIAGCLLTFESVRNLGVSLLTSAGIAGIILGLAAQKSIGMVLGGLQLAITQPIRLGDIVVVDNQRGRVEEMTLTYIVLKMWDERRLILPVTYFLDRSFENYTRKSTETMGSVSLFVDYRLPVEDIRNMLTSIVEGDSRWNGKRATVMVADAKEAYKELRIVVSSNTLDQNYSLCTDIREKMIDYINVEHPDCFARRRVYELENTV